MLFLVIFILLPLLEIFTAILVAGQIGWLLTLGIIALCSMLGVWQLKVQGTGAWQRVRDEVRNEKVPAVTMVDGALRVLAAVLLTVPGIVTTVLSLVLFVRPIRRVLGKVIGGATLGRFKVPFMVVSNVGHAGAAVRNRRRSQDIVDVEGWEQDPRPSRPPEALPPSGTTKH